MSAKTIQAEGKRALAVLVATMALLVQALVVQAHWHPPITNLEHRSTEFGQPGARTPGSDRSSPAHDCVICREHAMAGHYTLPPVTAFLDERPRGADPSAPLALATLLARQVSHSWHSRDPPFPSA